MNLKTVLQIAASWREGDDDLDLTSFIMEGYPYSTEYALYAMEQEVETALRVSRELSFAKDCMEHESPLVQALGHQQYEVTMESLASGAEAVNIRVRSAAEKIAKIMSVIFQFITKYLDITRRWADQYFSFTAAHKRTLDEMAQMARATTITNESELATIYNRFPKQVAYTSTKVGNRWEVQQAEQVIRIVSTMSGGIDPSKIRKLFHALPQLIGSFTTQPVEKSRQDLRNYREALLAELKDYLSSGKPTDYTSGTSDKGDSISLTHPTGLGNMAYRITYRREAVSAPTATMVFTIDQKLLLAAVTVNPVTPEYVVKVTDVASEAMGKIVAGRAGYDTSRDFANNVRETMQELQNRLNKTELSPELTAFFKEVVEAMPSYITLYHSCFKVQADALYNWAMGVINLVAGSKAYWKQK